MPVSPSSASFVLPRGYADLLEQLKSRVRVAQSRATLSVNREMTELYWHIGESIIERQQRQKWGDQFIGRLAKDLTREFPNTAGFSRFNLYRMRALVRSYRPAEVVAQPALQLLQGRKCSGAVAQTVHHLAPLVRQQLEAELTGNLPQSVGEIPWGHNVLLLQKLKHPLLRIWYARQTISYGWTRALLTHHIEVRLHEREGKAVSNFEQTLPSPQHKLAQQALKDPYHFDFLTLGPDAHERELEQGLLDDIQKFLLELGVGFAFLGRQVHLEVAGKDYYLDLLFYHVRLRCYVVIDLKAAAFEPEFAGKMNFYLSAVDDQMRHADDRPSIGLLLCKAHDRMTVEYALRNSRQPIGVAEWRTNPVGALPKQFRGKLPTVEEIAEELKKTRSRGSEAERAKSRKDCLSTSSASRPGRAPS